MFWTHSSYLWFLPAAANRSHVGIMVFLHLLVLCSCPLDINISTLHLGMSVLAKGVCVLRWTPLTPADPHF